VSAARSLLTVVNKKPRLRRTKAALATLRNRLREIAEANRPLTLRNLFYCAVSKDLVEKTQREYKAVMRAALDLRRGGDMPWDWLVDSTRWMRKPNSYSSLHDLLDEQQRFYRRDLWQHQTTYVEVWCESESLAGMIGSVTDDFDVPLMPGRGYSSHPFLYSAAQAIANQVHGGKQAFIYYVGDFDPSGLDIDRYTAARLREYAGTDVSFHFERLAVTRAQIQQLRLPTRPPKPSDTRSAGFRGGCVEAEAIPPDHMRGLLREAIERHIDPDVLEITRRIEQRERETLARMAARQRDRR